MVLIAQRAHAASLHQECRLSQGLPDPADGKGSQDMAVADDHDVALALRLAHGPANDRFVVALADLVDQPIDPGDDLFWRLAAGAAVAPDVPVLAEAGGAPPRADLGGRDALVLAVVPLGDVRRDGDARVRARRGVGRGRGGGVFLPGEGVVAADVEELERALGAVPWGDVAVRPMALEKGPGGKRGRELHVHELSGCDEAVVTHECAACGAHPLLAVMR